jgi:hypothetical protein
MRDALHAWMRRNGWDALVPDQQPRSASGAGPGGGSGGGSQLLQGDSFDSTSSSTSS